MSEPVPFPSIETERLLLREIVESDAEDLFAIHGDSELMRWFGSEPLKDLAAAQGLVKTFVDWRNLANPGTRWAIQSKLRYWGGQHHDMLQFSLLHREWQTS